MVVSTKSLWDEVYDGFGREYEAAVVYADRDGEDILHDGPVRVLPNGYLELPTGRLLSPDAVHHVDPRPTD